MVEERLVPIPYSRMSLVWVSIETIICQFGVLPMCAELFSISSKNMQILVNC